LNNVAVLGVTTTAKVAASLVVVTAAALAAAISSEVVVDVLKVMAKVASSHVRKVVLRSVLKVVKTATVLRHLAAIASSHVKVHHAATSAITAVSAKAVALLAATLVKAPHAVISVPHAALMTALQPVALAPHLKQVVHRLISQHVQRQVSRLAAVLMRRSAHLSPAHLVN
jgi:hypothetical protein